MTRGVNNSTVSGSFRDPCGFMFWKDGIIYRQVNSIYKENYEYIIQFGLYDILVKEDLLIPHEEVELYAPQPETTFKIIKPERIPFISYPYEWSFSQLKDAALTTLKIEKISLNYGMSLKDCSAYNIQFREGKPIFIDTLSFEKYREGQPWIAYRQFCQHFLAPLSLMSHKDIRLSQLLRIYMDGVPLDLTSSLLPWFTHLKLSLLFHIHLHARSQKHYSDKPAMIRKHKLSRMGLVGIINHLESAVRNLKWQPSGTEWADYYQNTNYLPQTFVHKKIIVAEFLDRIKPAAVWDLGANIGTFSRLVSDRKIPTISIDIDPAAVEHNYRECVIKGETNILPLIIDLTNPSSGIGWENKERMSLKERGPADAALALALVHHLAIANNVPLAKIAGFCSDICKSLIIEFVPKTDSQMQKLLATREDIFPDYTQEAFEKEFHRFFTFIDIVPIKDSKRTLYLMQKHES